MNDAAIYAKAEKLAALIYAGMITEAAYNGVTVTPSELTDILVNDPDSETASYMIRNAYEIVALAGRMETDTDLQEFFRGSR